MTGRAKSTLDEMTSFIIFARVVEQGSFTAAAQALGISKAAVSERLSDLEARLGVRLLHRSTRRLSLTTEGLEVAECCARMVAAADEATAIAAMTGDHPRGTLRVSAPVALGQMHLGAATAAFASTHSAVHVELVLTDQLVDIVAERFDVAVRVAHRIPDTDLRAHALGRDAKILCAAPAYLEQRGAPSTPHDLTGHTCLRFSLLDARDEFSFRGAEGPVIPAVNGSFLTNNVAALRDAALAGLGLAVLPRLTVAADLAAGRLVELMPEHPLGEVHIFALYAAGRRTPVKVRAYLEALSRYFLDLR